MNGKKKLTCAQTTFNRCLGPVSALLLVVRCCGLVAVVEAKRGDDGSESECNLY